MRTRLAFVLLASTVAASIGCTPDSGEPSTFTPYAREISGVPVMARIAAGADGDLYLGGTFSDQIDFGGGALKALADDTIFVAHLDENGEHVMSGSTGAGDWVGGVAASNDGTFFVGGTYEGKIDFGSGAMESPHGGYLAIFGPDGAPERARDFDDTQPSTYVDSVIALPNGGVAIGARTRGKVSFGDYAAGIYPQIVVETYDAKGVFAWEVRIDTPTNSPAAIAVDEDGNVFLAGTTQWGFSAYGMDVSYYSMFVMKIDPQGQPVWVEQARDTVGAWSLPTVADIAVDGKGDVYVAGTHDYPLKIGEIEVPSTYATDIFLLKLTNHGKAVFARNFTTEEGASPICLSGAKDGGALLALGSFHQVNLGDGDLGDIAGDNALLARFDAEGKLANSLLLAGAQGGQHLYDVAEGPDGKPLIAGDFQGSFAIAGEEFDSGFHVQSFVARLEF